MIERWFQCRGRGSTPATEVLAGLSTFLALSYIFVVNPALLGHKGLPRHAVFFATVVTSAVATLILGVWTNLPFVLAPGMEINTYVAYYAVAAVGLTWREALGAVFWSGVLFLMFTITGLRAGIMDALPDGMKNGVGAAVGALLAAVAFRVSGVLVYDGVHLRGVGSIGRDCVVLLATTLVVFVLAAWRVRAAMLISIIAGSAIVVLLGIPVEHRVEGSGEAAFAALFAADLTIIATPRAWTIVLVLFLVDFYGSIAKFVGLVRNTAFLARGTLPRVRDAMLVDGAAAITGSLMGTTSVLVYAESGVGIAAGGRTGLTAVTAGAAMLACFLAAPALSYVPVVATSGALLYVAFHLLPLRKELRASDAWELAALAAMAGIVIATFALHLALLAGLVLYLVRDFSKGVRLNAYALGSLGLLLLGWALSW